jgi:hypothetical protein
MFPVIARSVTKEPSQSISIGCRMLCAFWLLAMSKAGDIDWRSINLKNIKGGYTYAVKGVSQFFQKKAPLQG